MKTENITTQNGAIKIYYAHHLWKYGTPIEQYELNIIKKAFPDAEIFNPSTDIPRGLQDDEAMILCIDALSGCNALVFSDLSGVVGKGVMEEIETANKDGKPVFRIRDNRLFQSAIGFERIESNSRRLHAIVKEIEKADKSNA